MHALSDVGYGKAYDIKEIRLGALRDNVKKTFLTNRVEVYREKDKIIKRVASFCGGGADEEAVAFAKEQGADVMVSSDFKHHVLLLAKESGVSVLTLTHYASENYGFEQFYKKISERISLPCVFITDQEML
jgi:putative NIF3 family GTP cyclohydrolase 1 type 2